MEVKIEEVGLEASTCSFVMIRVMSFLEWGLGMDTELIRPFKYVDIYTRYVFVEFK
jgi:hypothetical protein